MGGYVSSKYKPPGFEAGEERMSRYTAPGSPGLINELNPKRQSVKDRRKGEAREFGIQMDKEKADRQRQKARAREHALTRGDPNTFTDQTRLGEPTLGRQRLLS